MSSSQIIVQVKNAILNYPNENYLYIHRAVIIVQCLGWEFFDNRISTEFQFKRVVIGNDWQLPKWRFGIAWEDISLVHLKAGILSGCQLGDGVVLDPKIYEMATHVNLNSDEATIKAFKEQLYRF